jgi:hypothetical protein
LLSKAIEGFLQFKAAEALSPNTLEMRAFIAWRTRQESVFA